MGGRKSRPTLASAEAGARVKLLKIKMKAVVEACGAQLKAKRPQAEKLRIMKRFGAAMDKIMVDIEETIVDSLDPETAEAFKAELRARERRARRRLL